MRIDVNNDEVLGGIRIYAAMSGDYKDGIAPRVGASFYITEESQVDQFISDLQAAKAERWPAQPAVKLQLDKDAVTRAYESTASPLPTSPGSEV